ncbi:uncharacterized protein K441DRAFT_681363 [Cenococcum geophilum 1.58]|uniref:uncharacterized protein n=1 Tax=Cenococcum geophilum 1.58 TaxID=794803 RepID=UPI00358E8A21|nr:hypothetical protein K441DRAFT_681363 [Cenococcum geophilum 1.58]
MGCSSAYIILFVVLFTFLVDVAAAPISPSAADTERIAERMRAEGLSERDITNRLTSGIPSSDQPSSLLSTAVKAQAFLIPPIYRHSQQEKRDTSGDIPPGSLEAPELLPRSPAPDTTIDAIEEIINSVLSRSRSAERRQLAYEGMEGAVRRPQGSRYWGG